MALWAITGSNGFVGLDLARRLLERGTEVRGLDLDPVVHADFASIVGDVRDSRAVAALCRGADVVVHAAAALPIRRAAPEIRSVTVDGTLRCSPARRRPACGESSSSPRALSTVSRRAPP